MVCTVCTGASVAGAPNDDVAGALADHVDGAGDEEAGDARKDAGVHDAQSLDAPNA